MTRVLIADDHEQTRAFIRGALESSGFTVCAEVGDASAAVAAAMEELPDVCLLDIWMPGGGIAAAWEIAARLPETKVVMLTISSSDRHLFAALKAGASGYLLKEIPIEEARRRAGDRRQGRSGTAAGARRPPHRRVPRAWAPAARPAHPRRAVAAHQPRMGSPRAPP